MNPLAKSLPRKLAVICLLASLVSQAQTNISGIINHYAAVSAIDRCLGKLSVSDTAGFRPGETLLIFQMKGAEIQPPNTSVFGNVTNMNGAGFYESAVIKSVAAGEILLVNLLKNQYDAPGGLVQIVTFPKFENATVTATLKPKPWDGQTGGIVALEVAQTLKLNAAINADTCGFRGGPSFVSPVNNCYFLFSENDYFYPEGDWRGAPKGEGIAAPVPGREFGRGPQANGGGGGNDHNSGGGGGGNLSNGGIGGENDEPTTAGCDGYFPGTGGKKITDHTGRVFLGGGGGGGHTNNLYRSDGGNGGGIAIVIAGIINGSLPTISANGENCGNAAGDGAGGGGAGGSIICQAGSVPANFKLVANGGKGGNTRSPGENRCFGPGGGGSGGYVQSNQQVAASVLPGQPGTVLASTNACLGSSVGAQAGEQGLVENFQPIPAGTVPILPFVLTQQPDNQTVCEGGLATFDCNATGTQLFFQWQMFDGTAWQNLNTGGVFTGAKSKKLKIEPAPFDLNGKKFRCQVSAQQGCFVNFTNEVTLTVLQSPIPIFTASPQGFNVSFDNQSIGATQFLWDFGDGSTSTEPDPAHLYNMPGTFTVSLQAMNSCDTVVLEQIVDVLDVPTASFIVADTIFGCDGSATVQFQNTSSAGATAFGWAFPGGLPDASTDKNPSITYSQSGNYNATLVATNAIGSSTASQNFYVKLIAGPTADFNFSSASANFQFQNLSSGEDFLHWDFGDGSTSTEENPSHVFQNEGEFKVTLFAINVCDTAIYEETVSWFKIPEAQFSVEEINVGCHSVVVNFENESSNANVFAWSFPGGNPSLSSEANPSITYSQSGNYTATLTVQGPGGLASLTKSFSVQILESPTADFDFASSGPNFQFQNLSSGEDFLLWNFGDGSTSSAENPAHQFQTEGEFLVTLFAINACDTTVYSETVSWFLVPVAQFLVPDTTVGCLTTTIQFQNLSINSNTFSWSFPGGNPNVSNQKHPSVTYSQSGSYTATLIATGPAGVDTVVQNFIVEIYGLPTVNFSTEVLPMGVVNFTNLSSGAQHYVWFFGDGSESTAENPTHVYAQSGTYLVTLQAITPCGASVLQQEIMVQVVDVQSVVLENAFEVFPNPSSGEVFLRFSESHGLPEKVRVFDVSGKMVFEKTGGLNRLEKMALEGFSDGTFFVFAVFGEEGVAVKKLILNH